MLRTVDTSPSKSGDYRLPQAGAEQTAVLQEMPVRAMDIPPRLLEELWQAAEAEDCGLTEAEFGSALVTVGRKLNHGLPGGPVLDSAQKAAFYRSIHLAELALAHGCALGREVAWERFLRLYRSSLTQAAVAICGSASLGQELADSLYAELYGLREVEGERRSPLGSYSGRGSLMGWLRTTLAQRHVNHHRTRHRDTPIDEVDPPAPISAAMPVSADLARLADAVTLIIKPLGAEDRFLLSSYFLDRQTIHQIGRTLGVHESTISRRIKRLTGDLRQELIGSLRADGLSKRAADEALGADPRDLEINLRALLQSSQIGPFSDKTATGRTAPAPDAASDSL